MTRPSSQSLRPSFCSSPRALLIGSLIALLGASGCGSGSNSNSGGSNNGSGGSSSFTAVNVQGQYEVQANSSTTPGAVTLIEANFTQTDTDVFAQKGSVVVIGGTLNNSNNFITLQTVAGECDNSVLGLDSLQGSFSSATQAAFTLTESGSIGTGTATANATFSSDGTKITSGTYSVPAQCGFQADSGAVVGVQIPAFSGAYSGMLANSSGGQDTVIVTVSQTGLTLAVSGTDNGTSFTLNGSVVGATFDVAGTIAGEQVQALGLYDIVNNDFLVYNNQGEYLGQLNAGSNPSANIKPSRLRPNESKRLTIQQN
jgi:hypothetical protein